MEYSLSSSYWETNTDFDPSPNLFSPLSSNWADVPEIPCCAKVSLRDKREASKSTATLAPGLAATLASGGGQPPTKKNTKRSDEHDPAFLRLNKTRVRSNYLGMEHRKILEIFYFFWMQNRKNSIKNIFETTNQCLQSSCATPCLWWTQAPVQLKNPWLFPALTSPQTHWNPILNG